MLFRKERLRERSREARAVAGEGLRAVRVFRHRTRQNQVPGADRYELVVSIDSSFSNPVILKAGEYALRTTAWKSNISLENDTTYYWKIRSIVDDSYSDWSRESAFSTGTADEASTAVVMEEAQVFPIQSQTTSSSAGFPDWALYLGIGLLIVIVLLQTTTFLMVVITSVLSVSKRESRLMCIKKEAYIFYINVLTPKKLRGKKRQNP